MLFEREGCKALKNPSAARLATELQRLRTTGPSSFATLTSSTGDYVQAAGSPGGLLLEKRAAQSGHHYRAFQDVPVVPFADGTELRFAGGRVVLNAKEWFRLAQVVEVFTAFLQSAPEPSYVRWRDISGLLTQGRPIQ